MPDAATVPTPMHDQLPTMEKWQSKIGGRFYLNRFTPQGVKAEAVVGTSVFYLTPAERAFNQSKCKPGQDPFTNGTFVPLDVEDTKDSKYELEQTPNQITDEEIVDLLIHADAEQARILLGAIDGVAALSRILHKAEEIDAPQSRRDAVRERLREVAPWITEAIRSSVMVAEFPTDHVPALVTP
jgi:hypothetical protein